MVTVYMNGFSFIRSILAQGFSCTDGPCLDIVFFLYMDAMGWA